MDNNLSALTFDELATAKAAIRVIRYLTVVATGLAVPMALVLATPLIGWALLIATIASPLIFTYVLVAAARQADVERRAAR
jgi:hypothetical protein